MIAHTAHSPHPHRNEGDDPEPGHLPVDPDQGPVPAGIPVDPEDDGPVDPQV